MIFQFLKGSWFSIGRKHQWKEGKCYLSRLLSDISSDWNGTGQVCTAQFSKPGTQVTSRKGISSKLSKLKYISIN